MSDEIKVFVNDYGPDRNLLMIYFDPITGKRHTRTAGTRDFEIALGKAGAWEAELKAGRYKPASKITWAEFRERYEKEKLATLAPGTRVTAAATLDAVKEHLDPDRLAKLTPSTLSTFQQKLREAGAKPATVARHLRHLKAALRWGKTVGLLVEVPAIEMPKLGKTLMRGRPLAGEEFDRMVLNVAKVRPHDGPQWLRLLHGLWLSGLRLGEGLALSWDAESGFAVDLAGRRPAFRILAEAQKARRDEVLPMTPDFAQWLLATPEELRQGLVFPLVDQAGESIARTVASKVIAAIGEKANVVTDKAAGKFATAHDLRRSFGTRWSKKVMPAVLKVLMRHAEISTTMKYYVGQDADAIADELWKQHGEGHYNTHYNKAAKPVESEEEKPVA